MTTRSYRGSATSALPSLTLPWQEQLTGGSNPTWGDLDLSSGYTFTLTLTDTDATVGLTKTTNIVGLTTGVRVDWAVGDLDLTVGMTYDLELEALETGTGKSRDYEPSDSVRIAIT